MLHLVIGNFPRLLFYCLGAAGVTEGECAGEIAHALQGGCTCDLTPTLNLILHRLILRILTFCGTKSGAETQSPPCRSLLPLLHLFHPSIIRPLSSLVNEISEEGDVTALEHIFFETLMALKAEHNHGRFHGSVRAENVFVQPVPGVRNRFKVFLVGWGSMYSYGNDDYEEKHFIAHEWATLDGVHSPDERVAIIDRLWKEEVNPSTFDAEAADMWGFMAMVMEAFGAADQVGPIGIAVGTGAMPPPAMPSDLWKLLVGLSQKPNNRPTRADVEANHWVCRWAD
ncbi:unnamed protein product, partial [Choristocarpus tenellus]